MHPMYSMLYTANLGLCDYVLFSQIQSQTLSPAAQSTSLKEKLHSLAH